MESFFQQGKNKQLVVAFHGTGGNEYQLLTTLATLYPEASVLTYLGTVGVGSERRFFAPLRNGQLKRADFEAQVTAFLMETWPAVAHEEYQEIILIGYSNGANFALGLLEKNPKLATTAILLHPSNLDYHFAGKSETKVILTTGAQDSQSLPGDIVQLKNQLSGHFTDVYLVIADGGHQLTEQELTEIQELI
ncbi:alpha/beta hydrolase [Enterococcus sp. HY326]|uniref:alpha/beta hydrolase n=1 Tax=Enterococcus sp. HY326 TaxID=2971265 RepID=UPI00223ECD6E|nr:phospholipase [Enterococcus sp. HY326]